MNYEYKMVQIPPNIEIKEAKDKAQVAAMYLQKAVNTHAQQGWEFYRVDTIGVAVRPGCLASLLGARSENLEYYVITLRRPRVE